jgi:hypothetical protein
MSVIGTGMCKLPFMLPVIGLSKIQHLNMEMIKFGILKHPQNGTIMWHVCAIPLKAAYGSKVKKSMCPERENNGRDCKVYREELNVGYLIGHSETI